MSPRHALAAALLAACGSAQQGLQVTFTKDSAAFFDASVDKSAKPVAHAWSDLKRDWYKVIGVPLIDNGALPGVAWSGGAYLSFFIDPTLGREGFTVVAGSNTQYGYRCVSPPT